MYRAFFFCLTVLACLWADETPAIIAGDAAHKVYDDQKAASYYKKALSENPRSYEAAWKLARTIIDQGKRNNDKAQREKLYIEGEKYAQLAMKINPQGAEGYLQHGVAIGRIALDTTAREKIRLAKEIRIAFEKCISIDPKNDFAAHALGRWHREMATLNWLEKGFADMFLGGLPSDASVELAAEYFLKAIALNPKHLNHHIEYALTLEVLKKPLEAIKEYERALAMPKTYVDDDEFKQKARERLAALRK